MVMNTGSTYNTTLGAGNQSLVIDEETMKLDLPNHVKISIAASLCLLVGVIQVRIGFITLNYSTTCVKRPLSKREKVGFCGV